jgi:hypothetical protein
MLYEGNPTGVYGNGDFTFPSRFDTQGIPKGSIAFDANNR